MNLVARCDISKADAELRYCECFVQRSLTYGITYFDSLQRKAAVAEMERLLNMQVRWLIGVLAEKAIHLEQDYLTVGIHFSFPVFCLQPV